MRKFSKILTVLVLTFTMFMQAATCYAKERNEKTDEKNVFKVNKNKMVDISSLDTDGFVIVQKKHIQVRIVWKLILIITILNQKRRGMKFVRY